MEKLYFSGDHFFTDVIKGINGAKESVIIEVYIYAPDDFGREIKDLLIKTAARGVTVTLIKDAIGSWDFPSEWEFEMKKAGVHLYTYNPLTSRNLPEFVKKFSRLKYLLGIFTRMNRRTHRKIYFIDKKILFTGSMNVSQVHLTGPDYETWKDWGIQVIPEHPEALEYSIQKNRKNPFYWLKKSPYHYLKDDVVRLNDSPIKRNHHYGQLLGRMEHAQKNILIVTPYFNPRPEIILRMKRAAKRGVDVRVVTTKKSDVPFFPFLQKIYYPILLGVGIRIFEYQPCILHAKCTWIDDWVIMGSSNMNYRSVLHDLEIDVYVKEAEHRLAIKEEFEKLIESSCEINMEGCMKRSQLSRFMSWFIKLFRYWL